MSLKRRLPDVYKLKKKQNQAGVAATEQHGVLSVQVENKLDVDSAFEFLKSLFLPEKFEHRLPAIVMKHQFYSVLGNRTEVDKQLNMMQIKGKIRLFQLGPEDDPVAVVDTKDYLAHVKNSKNAAVDTFLRAVVEKCPDVSYSKESLMHKFSFTEQDITALIRHGVLTVRDVGSLWLSVPGAGEFVASFHRGRLAVLSFLKRTRYKEMLQQQLEERKLPRKAKLTMLYHIHDVIGADLVSRYETSSGTVLRLGENEPK